MGSTIHNHNRAWSTIHNRSTNNTDRINPLLRSLSAVRFFLRLVSMHLANLFFGPFFPRSFLMILFVWFWEQDAYLCSVTSSQSSRGLNQLFRTFTPFFCYDRHTSIKATRFGIGESNYASSSAASWFPSLLVSNLGHWLGLYPVSLAV